MSFKCIEPHFFLQAHHSTIEKIIFPRPKFKLSFSVVSLYQSGQLLSSPVCGPSVLLSRVTDGPALGGADQVVGVAEVVRVPSQIHLAGQRLVGGHQGVDLFLQVTNLGVKVTPRISTGCNKKLIGHNT